MKKIALLLFTAALLVPRANALNLDNLLALSSMPLAVAAVSDVQGVPQDQLADLVATLNQADVPPAQFVEVLRYVPVALVTRGSRQPQFVRYIESERSRGVTGPALIQTVVDRLRTYDVTPVMTLDTEPTTLVLEREYVPPVVIERVAEVVPDSLEFVEMPLAVAAVSDFNDVPITRLTDLVTTLNQADMPPAQFVEVMRYAPVTLVQPQQDFVQFVRTQTAQGITGPALGPVIVQQLPSFGVSAPATINLPPARQPERFVRMLPNEPRFRPAPQRVVVDENFFPPEVRHRPRVIVQPQPVAVAPAVAQPAPVRIAGPPGQVKKELGLQTGAEVVHGERRGHGHERGDERQRVFVAAPPPQPVMAQPMPRPMPQQAPPPQAPPPHPGNGHGPENNFGPGHDHGNDHGHGHEER